MSAADEIEAIKRLKARYFRCVDTKDWEGLVRVFTPEVSIDVAGSGPPRRSTAEEFVARVQRSLQDTVTVHHGHMPEIHLTSPTTATGVWSMEDKIWWPDGAPTRFLHGYGHYHESYALTEGGWRITTMQLTRLHVETDPPAS